MTSRNLVRSAPLSVLALLVLGACSSSKDQSLESQAIDGFIVKGAVFCDIEPWGVTGPAGRLTCPGNTTLVTVKGGYDVGFDKMAETGEIVFTGELRAPASLGYVTPLSTVAVQMASTSGVYQADLWDTKVAELGSALGDVTLDLKKNPSDFDNSPELIRFNAQIHQIISAFAKSQADYGTAIAAFATVMAYSAAAGSVVDLGSNVQKTLTAINAELSADSGLQKGLDELESSALTVAAINLRIDAGVAAGNLDTLAQSTAVPGTVEPATPAPGTVEPDTVVPDSVVPDIAAPGTVEPTTEVPDTEVEATVVQTMDSQAIDGYIVRGAVSCDDDYAQLTGLAGRLTCPENTVLVTVRGGWDVGFDEFSETSNIPFVGQLRAPASLGYVTPLSTVAVQMNSTATGGYQADLWEQNVQELGTALGQATLDLKKDPSDIINNPELIRLNAQIHQVISAFAKSEADYETVIAAFATVITQSASNGSTLDLESNVIETLLAMNAALPRTSALLKTYSQIEESALMVAATNQAIDAAVNEGDPDKLVAGTVVDVVADAAFARASVTIDRSTQSVSLTSSNGTVDLSIDDFEDDTLINGSYQTQVDSGLVRVSYNNDVLQFDKNLVNVQVTMGFELKSTVEGEIRGLSFYSDDIRLSATKGQSDSLIISLPEEATLHAVGIDSLGTVTAAEVQLEAENTFRNANGQFSVNYSSIVDQLEDLGYEDIFANAGGNYEMTLIIGGIQFKELSANGAVVPAKGYDISIGDEQRNGAGFKGYISYLY